MKNSNETFEKLKYYRIQNDKEKLAREVRRMSKVINERYRQLEKKDLSKDSYAYKVSQGETGRQKPRYTESQNKLENMDIVSLFELGLQLNVKIYSSSSRVRGVRDIQSKRIEKAVESLEATLGKPIDKKTFKDFLENGGSELLNYKYLDSEQVIDDLTELTKDGKVSVKEFINEFKRFRKQISEKKRLDYGRITRNLNNLVARKKKKSKRKKK